MKEKALRLYKDIVLFSWPILMFLSYYSISLGLSAKNSMGRGYGDGYPGPDAGKVLSTELTFMGIVFVVSLFVACVGIAFIALVTAAVKGTSLRSAFAKVYTALLLATWPIILIANIFPLCILYAKQFMW